MTYYIAGGSTFDNSEYKVYAYCDHSGYPDEEYVAGRPIQLYGSQNDPYWTLGLNTETMASGQQHAEFGLLDSWRIKITASGMWGYHTASGWMDILGGGGAGGDDLGNHIAEMDLDMDGNSIIDVGSYSPMKLYDNDAGWYKLGTLSGVGARVTVRIHGRNYGNETSAITIGQFVIGNTDDKFGGSFYRQGEDDPAITFEWVKTASTTIDCYISVPSYCRCSVELIEAHNFSLNPTATTKLGDPSGTWLNEFLRLHSNMDINGSLSVRNGASDNIRIYDRDADPDSYITMYYDKVDQLGLRMNAVKDGAYTNKPLYLYNGSTYRSALYDNFLDPINLSNDFNVNTQEIQFSGSTVSLQYTANRILCKCDDFFEILPDTDQYGLVIRDMGGSTFGNIKNVDGVTYIGDNTITVADMLAINGTAFTFPQAGTIYLPGGGYMDSAEHYAETHIRVRNGHSLLAYSTGNDKYIQVYHDDADGRIIVGTGDLLLEPAGDVRSSKKIYNAVYNDYADYWKANHGVHRKPGYCYSLEGKGLKITDKRADKACMGICSDTYGYATGPQRNGIPISIAGFLLAHVDREYEAGDFLVPNEDGILTIASASEVMMQLAIAKYMFKETKIKTKGVKVKERYWVKVL